MAYIAGIDLWYIVAALVIGIIIGAWIWAKPRHRVTLSSREDAPLSRTLDRIPAEPSATAPSAIPEVVPHVIPPSSMAPVMPDIGAIDPAALGGGALADEIASELASPFLSAPEGEPDDLRRMKGVGPKLNTLLGELGVFHFRQIARWSDEDVEIVDARLGTFRGRIHRDRWREQAELLAQERMDEFEEKFGGKLQG